MNSKEELDLLIKVALYREEDDIDMEETPIYKEVLKKLEVLEILKDKLTTDQMMNLAIWNNTLSAREYNKVKEWLENEQTK